MKDKITYVVSIKYKGKYPCLCRQPLTVTLTNPKDKNDKMVFKGMTIISGGICQVDNNGNETLEKNPWTLLDMKTHRDVSEDFPKEYIPALLCEINTKVPWGCCGGCL